MLLTSSTVKFVNTVESYRPTKRIKDMGFGGLLQMPATRLRTKMIIEIIKRFEPSNQNFIICGQNIQIHLEDVKDIMELSIEGKNVFQHKGPKANKKRGHTTRKTAFGTGRRMPLVPVF